MGGKKQRYYKQFNPSMIKAIFERDGGMCIYCGAPAMQIDHVIPAIDGGKPTRSNGVCCCRKCNAYKRNHPQDIEMLTKAIFWLLQQGEDTSWMDNCYHPGQ